MTNTFKDVFIKLTNIFSVDFYIIRNKYIVGGEQTEAKNRGYFLCEINEATRNILEEVFDSSFIYYIPDIKIFKKDPNYYTKLDECPQPIHNRITKQLSLIQTYMAKGERLFDKVSLDDLNKLFDSNTIISFDVGDSKKVLLGKEMFPLITKTTTTSLIFSSYYDEIARLQALILRYPFKYFDVYNFIHFIDLESDEPLIRG